MPFNTLLLHHLLPDLAYSEQGIGISVKKEKGESVLFFWIDCEKSQFVKKYNLKNKCDILIYFANINKKVLCFVELKGSDSSHATTQVIATCQNMPIIKEIKDKKAVIILAGSSPQVSDKKRLKDVFGDKVLIKSGAKGSTDISDFLRK